MRRIKPDNPYEPKRFKIIMRIIVIVILIGAAAVATGEYHQSKYYTKSGKIKVYWENGLGEDAARGFPKKEVIRFHLPHRAQYAKLMINKGDRICKPVGGELSNQDQSADINTYYFRAKRVHPNNAVCWLIFQDAKGNTVGVSNKVKMFYSDNWES